MCFEGKTGPGFVFSVKVPVLLEESGSETGTEAELLLLGSFVSSTSVPTDDNRPLKLNCGSTFSTHWQTLKICATTFFLVLIFFCSVLVSTPSTALLLQK